MRVSILVLVSVLHVVLVNAALNHRRVLHRRQVISSPPAHTSPSPSPTPPPPPPPPPPPSPPATSPTTPPPPDSPTPPPPPGPSSTPPSSSSPSSTSGSSSTLPTVASVTPTGPPPLDTGTTIPPLANITLGMATKAPPAFTNPFRPGATPPVKGAPVLPPAFTRTGTWPDRDRVPPTNSTEVQQWMKELEGRNIPNLAPTTDGTCLNNTAAAADAVSRGWWTCGGPTRPTDIVACPTKYDWGVSFDDGPSYYTPNLLNYLDEKDISATFFVVGSRVYEHPDILIDEYMSGHEISVHTWSHRPLTSLTNEQVVAELGWTRKAIKSVIGVTPLTMRPPYGDIDDRVRAISLAMGMIPILWTQSPSGNKFDTNDWRVAGGVVNGTYAFDTFQTILNDASTLDTGFIVLQHDISEISIDLAVGYTLDAALVHQPKFTLKPVGQCMRLPTTNLYLESNQNTSFPYQAASGKGIDVSGSGTIDTKSGDGGSTASSVRSLGEKMSGGPMMSWLSFMCLLMMGLLL